MTDGSVKLNRAGGGASKLDWSTFTGPSGHIGMTLPTIDVDAGTDLHLSGTVTVTLTGLFSATGSGSLDVGQVSDPSTVGTGASATALHLDVAVAGGPSGSLNLISITQGAKSWLGVDASGISIGLNAVPGLNLAVTGGTLQLNRAGGGAAKLNWTTFTPAGMTIPFTLPIDDTIDLTVGGRLSGDFFGLLSGAVEFSLAQKTVDADVDGVAGFDATPGHDIQGGELALFSLSFDPSKGDSLSVGSDGFGLQITSGSIVDRRPLLERRRATPAAGSQSRAPISAPRLTLPGIADIAIANVADLGQPRDRRLHRPGQPPDDRGAHDRLGDRDRHRQRGDPRLRFEPRDGAHRRRPRSRSPSPATCSASAATSRASRSATSSAARRTST